MIPRCLTWAFLLCALSLAAAVYVVGPDQTHTNLQSIAPLLRPGDLVELMGQATYRGDVRFTASGTAAQPITIRGKPIVGRRPVIAGVQGAEAAVIRISGDYYVLEDLEITGGGDTNATRGVRHVGHGSVLRRVAVYDVDGHGILNSDAAGSLTLYQVTVARCGRGEVYHQIYIGMDTLKYPDAVFRMEFCHVLEGRGGNNVKSRARRTELWYNWLEGAWGRELELLGPDRQGQPASNAPTVRCDALIVGNVLHKSRGVLASALRVGGDGSGTSHGRAQFIHNTFLMAPEFARAGVFKLQDAFEALEVYHGVFYAGGKPLRLLYDPGLSYRSEGAHNWVPRGSTHLPRHWQQTHTGPDPGFVQAALQDWRPLPQSPLVKFGQTLEASLPRPRFEPARILATEKISFRPRPAQGRLSLGAFEP
ncbi:hypothetical protein NXS98_08705 [Fontisphaera persica]|uniref:hypothetical protein n=1 Tax=Fontisphaera persica TaxID=2974023 RepID=UPI0024BF7EBA|nr:hypothetical protein [Fontisphaera persica]WCJ57815.1 hypothetical protein NXS98_08705 [Fontisphaera persica]